MLVRGFPSGPGNFGDELFLSISEVQNDLPEAKFELNVLKLKSDLTESSSSSLQNGMESNIGGSSFPMVEVLVRETSYCFSMFLMA